MERTPYLFEVDICKRRPLATLATGIASFSSSGIIAQSRVQDLWESIYGVVSVTDLSLVNVLMLTVKFKTS